MLYINLSEYRLKVLTVLLLFLTCSYIENAEAELFAGCDHEYVLTSTQAFLESPYYPNSYPPNTSCRYKFVAPQDYEITANCTINMYKAGNSCSSELFYVARDGDLLLRDSEQFCGYGNLERKSLFRTITLAYVSYGERGNFRCQLDLKKRPCECGWTVNSRIVNGKEASLNEYPSMAALMDLTSKYLFCGATIASHRFLITAAHCTRFQPNADKIAALVGRNNLQENTPYSASHAIEQIIEHFYYNPNTDENDIALLKTAQDIEWSRGVGPICLPPNGQKSFALDIVDVIGWGTTYFTGPTSDILQKVSLMVLENSSCQTAYNGIANISANQLCTYDYTGNGSDSCQYDSGGPVILRQSRMFLIGCISFGQVCGQGGFATGVNTRITSYLAWIDWYTGGTTCTAPLSE